MGREKETYTFLNSVDTDKVEEILNQTEKNVQYFNDTVKKITKSYSEALDNLMSDLYVECIKDVDRASNYTLEKYFLELANMLYFMGPKLEQASTFADMSKSAAKEKYSKTYLDNQVKEADGKNKTTVAELQAQAELGAQYESVMSNVYSHVYSELRFKVEAAQDMLSALKKILSGRQIEMNFNMYNKGKEIEE